MMDRLSVKNRCHSELKRAIPSSTHSLLCDVVELVGVAAGVATTISDGCPWQRQQHETMGARFINDAKTKRVYQDKMEECPVRDVAIDSRWGEGKSRVTGVEALLWVEGVGGTAQRTPDRGSSENFGAGPVLCAGGGAGGVGWLVDNDRAGSATDIRY